MATKIAKVSDNGHANRITEPLESLATGKEKAVEIKISPPNMKIVAVRLTGTSPLMLNRFGEKARAMIQATQEAGSTGKKGKKREAKDFEQCYKDALHTSPEGWHGIHASGFRAAMVDACKLAGFFMTRAKLAVFIIADGYGMDGAPLVRITKGEPHMDIGPVRNASGVVDLRARPRWEPGWQCILRVRFDADELTATDVVNLIARVGMQCGIGEGRPNSKASCGQGMGLFDVSTADE